MSLKDRMDFALKAFSMSFPRQSGYSTYSLLPRTRYDYGRDVGQGLGNTAVLACLGWLMRNFPEAPIRLRKRAPDGSLSDVPISSSGPGYMLSLLEYPNDFYSGALMDAALILDYASTGNAYQVKERNASGRAVRLWWIPKILMRPRWYPNPDPAQGQTGYIDWYEYNPNGIPFRLEVNDVIHHRDGLDPRNGREGLSKMAALAREIFTDDEASNFSATLLANLGVPGVILSPKDTGTASTNRLTDPEGVKQSFMQKFGGDKRGEPLVLTSPTDVTTLSFNPEQLALKDLRRIPEERVSAILGVPAIVAGLGAGLDHATYANYGEAREAGYQEGIIPTHRTFDADYKVQLLNEFVGDPRDYVVDHDYSEVKALQEDQGKLWERNTKALVSGGITRRIFKLNIGEEPDKTDDVYYVPIALGVINAAEPPPALESEQAQKPIVPFANQALGPGGQPLAQLVPRNAPAAAVAAGQTGPGTAMDAPGSIPATMTGP
jgi:phage portal protein BeeE